MKIVCLQSPSTAIYGHLTILASYRITVIRHSAGTWRRNDVVLTSMRLLGSDSILNRGGSYPSGHFIWNLWNKPSATFIHFIWNDHSCVILFIAYGPLKWDFIAFKMILFQYENAFWTWTFSMTLRVCAEVLLHVCSYDFYDMTLSTD